MIAVHEHVLADPLAYRRAADAQAFASFEMGPVTFHGIASPPAPDFDAWFAATYPVYEATLSFLRRSPFGQIEPNYIHTDVDMGDLTALLYLNPQPPDEDGTLFWEHIATKRRDGGVLVGERGRSGAAWRPWDRVHARFNRCVVFSAALFHSRSLEANWGDTSEARLTQVLFARVRV